VLKGDLKATIRSVNDVLVTTLGACGDVVRNVIACPAPLAGGLREEVLRVARQVSDHLLPANPGVSRDLARRRGRGGRPARGGSPTRFTGPGTCRASSRSRSGSRTIIAATCTRTTWGSWWSHREIGSRDSTCWWAAAWGALTQDGHLSAARRHAGIRQDGRGARGGRGRGQSATGSRQPRRPAPRAAQVPARQAGTGMVSRAGGASARSSARAGCTGPGVGHRGPSRVARAGKGGARSWAYSSRTAASATTRTAGCGARCAAWSRPLEGAFASRPSRTCC